MLTLYSKLKFTYFDKNIMCSCCFNCDYHTVLFFSMNISVFPFFFNSLWISISKLIVVGKISVKFRFWSLLKAYYTFLKIFLLKKRTFILIMLLFWYFKNIYRINVPAKEPYTRGLLMIEGWLWSKADNTSTIKKKYMLWSFLSYASTIDKNNSLIYIDPFKWFLSKSSKWKVYVILTIKNTRTD